MKTFRDSSNVSWTVFEVRREVTSKGEGSYLTGGFSDGWLCFECVGQKRRLVRYPKKWRELSDGELERLLSQALPAPRTTFRAPDDLTDGSAAEL
jgi:hypothetical protein